MIQSILRAAFWLILFAFSCPGFGQVSAKEDCENWLLKNAREMGSKPDTSFQSPYALDTGTHVTFRNKAGGIEDPLYFIGRMRIDESAPMDEWLFYSPISDSIQILFAGDEVRESATGKTLKLSIENSIPLVMSRVQDKGNCYAHAALNGLRQIRELGLEDSERLPPASRDDIYFRRVEKGFYQDNDNMILDKVLSEYGWHRTWENANGLPAAINYLEMSRMPFIAIYKHGSAQSLYQKEEPHLILRKAFFPRDDKSKWIGRHAVLVTGLIRLRNGKGRAIVLDSNSPYPTIWNADLFMNFEASDLEIQRFYFDPRPER